MASPATLQSIAAACGVSAATISRALAGRRYVASGLRATIEAEARRQGYQRNPLVGDLMAHVRGGRTLRFLGNLALVHVVPPDTPEINTQLRRIAESARARAAQLGFHAEIFNLGPHKREETALTRVLLARGVTGVLFLYPAPSAAPTNFPWHEFSNVALDYARPEPLLSTVCHDHFATLKSALSRLHAAGYRRIGLFIERFKDARTDFRWSGSFLSYRQSHGEIGDVPICTSETMNQATFLRWYRAHRPDLVIGHRDDAVKWLRGDGVRVPQDTGFFSLNWEARSLPCAGIDPQLELQGKVAAEALIAHVQRGERGLNPAPKLIMVRGQVKDGPTITGRLVDSSS